jgi:hypothetical protein
MESPCRTVELYEKDSLSREKRKLEVPNSKQLRFRFTEIEGMGR